MQSFSMQGQERVHHVNFCSLIREERNIFHSQSTVKTLESASQLPYRHMWRRLSNYPLKDTPKIEVTMEPDEESNYTPEEK